MLTGSEFQTLGAENRKAQDPKVVMGDQKLMRIKDIGPSKAPKKFVLVF